MKSKAVFLALLVIAFCVRASAEIAGTVERTEQTPDELRDLSITFERVAFSFPQPVLGRFWIEFRSGSSIPKKQVVPGAAVPPATRFDLGYVHTSDHSAFVSVTTTHDGRADRRTGSYGYGTQGGTRAVTYTPTSNNVPLDADFELFSAEIKPGWRRPKEPIFHYRIMARFTVPK